LAVANSLDDAVSLVGSRVALVAGPGVDAAFLSRVRQIVHAKDPFGLLIDAMTDSGLRNIPSLACAVTERGGVRVLVRGAATAVVKTTAGRSETISASQVSTWHEQAVAGAEEVALVAANAAGASTTLMLFLDPAAPRRAAAKGAGKPARAVKPGVPPMPVTLDPPTPPTPATPQNPPVAPRRQVPPPASPGAAPAHAPLSNDTISERSTPAAPSSAPPFDQDDDGEADFEHLIGETQFRGAEAAAVRPHEEPGPAAIDAVPTFAPPVAGTAPAPSAPSAPGDHDGHTISISELRGVVDQHRSDPTIQVGSTVGGRPAGPTVQAVHCGAGHPNPPTAEGCRVCGMPIHDHSVTIVPRPTVGRIQFADGSVVELDRGLLLGRKPTYAPGQEGAVDAPRLVAVPDPEQSLSRVHAELRVEGWQVLVLDRGSMNGTRVELPGQEPILLRPEEPCLLVAGARVNLADVASFSLS
jgi:hypothetical protein